LLDLTQANGEVAEEVVGVEEGVTGCEAVAPIFVYNYNSTTTKVEFYEEGRWTWRSIGFTEIQGLTDFSIFDDARRSILA
jgi:hypothetical protein